MKVLGHDNSPYLRKVRIVLEEKRIPYEYVQARGSQPGSPVPDYNPLAKIPVLVTDEGKGIYDSPVIVDYLDTRFPEPRLIPSGLDERVEVKRWATASPTRPWRSRTTTTKSRARNGTSGSA